VQGPKGNFSLDTVKQAKICKSKEDTN